MIFGGLFTAAIFGVGDSGTRISVPSFSCEALFSASEVYQDQVINPPAISVGCVFTLPDVSSLVPITINRVVSSGPDDCTENASFFNNTNPSIQLDSSGPSHGGFRFTDIPVLPGGPILSAKIILSQSGSPTSSLICNWYAWDHDDAPQFSSGTRPSGVTKTSASEPFQLNSAAATQEIEHDVTSIVEELVNREGWEAGNAINFIAFSTDIDSFEPYSIRSYEGQTPDFLPARLVIETLSESSYLNVPAVGAGAVFSPASVNLTSIINVPSYRIDFGFVPPDISVSYSFDIPPIAIEGAFSAPDIYQEHILYAPPLSYEAGFVSPAVTQDFILDAASYGLDSIFVSPEVYQNQVIDVLPIWVLPQFPDQILYQDQVLYPDGFGGGLTFTPPIIDLGTRVSTPAFLSEASFVAPNVIIDNVFPAATFILESGFSAPNAYVENPINVPAFSFGPIFATLEIGFDRTIDAPPFGITTPFTGPELIIDHVIVVPAYVVGAEFIPPDVALNAILFNPPPIAAGNLFIAPSIGGSPVISVPTFSLAQGFTRPRVRSILIKHGEESGREPISIIEIDQDFCSLVYGQSPCSAALGITGARKCFNTLNTCQDKVNFDKSVLTLRFCSPSVSFSKKVRAIPTVVSVGTSPTEINIGGGDINQSPLGRRASVTVEFKDIPYNDRLVDKYREGRGYKPEDRGSFWSKWLARNLYYQNRPLRVRNGYIGQPLEQMETRHYFIDKIEGPDSSGRVRVIAKDVLKFADNKKAQCPRPSNGRIDADIDANDTGFDLLPGGIGSEYPASGIAIIGDELVEYTRSGDTITLVERGLRGTEATSHDADDSFQVVKVFDGERVDGVIKTLLEDFANVPSEYVPFADWQQEAARWLTGYELNAWITEPTGVSDLLGELLQQCICYIWWDELDQQIKFKPIRPIDPEKDTLKIIDEDSSIVSESLRVERDADQRLSQVWFFYRQNNPVEGLDDPANYSRLNIRADLEAESSLQYGESRITKIFSRWFTAANAGQVITTGTQLLLRYRDNPLVVTLSLDAKDRDLKTGDVLRVTHRSIVDETGQPLPTLLQVIKTHEKERGHKVEYKCQVFGFIQRYSFVMENGAPDFSEATEDERNNGMWISENSEPYFPDGTDAYRII